MIKSRAKTHQLRVRLNNIRDTLTGEGLLAEAALNIVEHLCMIRVRFVQDILEPDIRRPEAVTEVLREDPAAIYRVSSSGSIYVMGHRGTGTYKHK
jgi:hypothetical protein